ncbi:hypothetical protein ACRASX_07615 [Flavobacterium sp. TMP13]|uniref:hypothetical protein n=1 Tax=Flavobacterium sp. TMP13 TaxID=3425950 RepID=UPI003D7859A6
MAKLIGPFKITGKLDDLTFYETADGTIVRMCGKTGITKQQFKENPIFDRIRQQSTEFGLCSRKAKRFKLLVQPFYTYAQEASTFGRCIGLLQAILKEDAINPIGSRHIYVGLQTPTGLGFLIGFEGNSRRPLSAVLREELTFDWKSLQLNLKVISPSIAIDWPELSTQVEIQLAVANWNCLGDTHETHYSNSIVVSNRTEEVVLDFKINAPQEQDLWLCYIHFKFSYTAAYGKVKVLHNKFNTTSLIGCLSFGRK